MWSLLNRSFALLVSALLLAAGPAAALDVLGPAPATAALQAAPAAKSSDGPPTDTPLVPGAMNSRQVITDPTGDTEILGSGNPTSPSDRDAPIDIESMSMAETDRDLVLSLKHRGYPETEATLSTVSPMDAMCNIRFTVNRDQNWTYILSMSYLHYLQGGYEAYGYLSVSVQEDDDFGNERFYDSDYLTDVWVALVAGDHYELVVPKEFITKGEDMHPLSTTDRLTDIRVVCLRNTGTFFLEYEDDAVAEGKDSSYPVTLATQTTEIAIELPEDAPRHLGIAVGETAKITVHVRNLLDRKLLVNLTAQVVDPSGKPLPGWSAKSAPTLESKSNGTLPASIVVSVAADLAHRDSGILKIVALPLGYEDQATFTMNVFATVPPTPEQNTLHFHRAPDFEFYYCGGFCIGGDMFGDVADPYPDIFIMNVLPEDPLYPNTPGEDDGIALLSNDYAFAYLDTPLGAPLRLDPEGYIEYTFAIKSGVARDIDYNFDLYTAEHYLGGGSRTIAVTENYQTFTVSIPLTGDVTDIARGNMIGLATSFRETLPFYFTDDSWVSSVEWDPAQTSLTLPLVAVPQPKVNITDGRALPSIALGNRTDKEEYVNPGNTQAFDLVLINEGTEKDVLRLTTETSTPGWAVTFTPGNRFELEPGKSAPLCMSVTAPKDAKEKDRVNITLTATSKLDLDVRTEIDLVLLVTTGVPIEPRTCADISEEDFVKPVTEEKDSPALAPLVALVFGLIAVAAYRRRL